MNFNIFLVSPRWYCAWVNRAITILEETINKNTSKKQIYVNHEIIHNKFIINYFEKKWIIFFKNNDEIPTNSIMILSAHWVWPKYLKKLENKNLQIIDTTCPFVLKVHLEVKKYLKNDYKIIYIWKKWHQEALWILENSQEKIFIIENIEDFEKINFDKKEKIVILTQTTLSIFETSNLIKKIKEKIPEIEIPKTASICYATTNRQKAVKELTKKCDIIFIVGSKNSSNSNKLKQLASKSGINTYLIDSYKEIDEKVLEKKKNIWISSWASVPEILVKELIKFLEKKWWIVQKEIITEKESLEFKINTQKNEVCISKGVGLNCPAKTSHTNIIFKNVVKVKKKNHFLHKIEWFILNWDKKILFNSENILKHFKSKNTKEFNYRKNLLWTVFYSIDKLIFNKNNYWNFIFKNILIKVVLWKQNNWYYFVKTYYIDDRLTKQYKKYLEEN